MEQDASQLSVLRHLKTEQNSYLPYFTATCHTSPEMRPSLVWTIVLFCWGCSAKEAVIRSCKGDAVATAVAAESEAVMEQCAFPWHSRFTPTTRAYLDYLEKFMATPRNRTLVFGFKTHTHHPWGSLSTFLNLYMSAAVATNRTFQIYDQHYSYAPVNMTGIDDGWFLYMSRRMQALAVDPLGGASGDLRSDIDTIYTWHAQTGGPGFTNADDYWSFYPKDVAVPETEETGKLSAWRSAVAAYTFCPRPWAVEEAMCRLKKMGIERRKYIAMHIRRGDKVGGEGRAIPVDAYFERAQLIRRTSIEPGCCDVVYVAYDDNGITDEINSTATKYNFRWVSDPFEHLLRRGTFMINGQGRNTDQAVVSDQLNSIKNMVLFSEAHSLVGADMSTYFRFARTLRGLDSSEMVAGHNLLYNILCVEWRPL